MKTIYLFLLVSFFLSCSAQEKPNIQENPNIINNSQIEKILVSHIKSERIKKSDFIDFLKEYDHCYVFITADWCGGGRWNLNNLVLPNINRINQGDVPLIVAYMGNFNKLGILPDSIVGNDTITFYHLEDVINNAFFHKMTIRKILKEVGNLKYDWAVPVDIEVKDGRASYLEKSFHEL